MSEDNNTPALDPGRPVPPLTLVKTEIVEQHPAAVFYLVTFADSTGCLFTNQTDVFLFDLTPVTPT